MFDGRVALISGVGPGLGRALAHGFADAGAAVVLAARNGDYLEEVRGEVEQRGASSIAVPTDITSQQDVDDLVRRATDAYGGIDVLVNNAFYQPPRRTIEDTDTDVWERAFAVNVIGSVRMTKAALEPLRARRGNVVFINSLSARRPRRLVGVYMASKNALFAAAQTLALELGPQIRVNSVAPGYIWGPPLQGFFAHQAEQRGVDPQVVYDEVAADTALQHLPTTEEVTDAVLYLASDRASAISGQTLDVNGGHWFH